MPFSIKDYFVDDNYKFIFIYSLHRISDALFNRKYKKETQKNWKLNTFTGAFVIADYFKQ